MDFDITTNATPQELLTIFPDAFMKTRLERLAWHIKTSGRPKISIKNIETPESWSPHRIKRPNRSPSDWLSNCLKSPYCPTGPWSSSTRDDGWGTNGNAALIEITTFRSGEKIPWRRSSTQRGTVGTLTDWRSPTKRFYDKCHGAKAGFYLDKRSYWITCKNPPTLQGLAVESDHFELIDRFEGFSRPRSKIIRSVGDAEDRIKEDALHAPGNQICRPTELLYWGLTSFSNFKICKPASWCQRRASSWRTH